MKKIKTFIVAAFLMIAVVAFAKTYNYAFLTSCGKSVHMSSNIELTDGQLVCLMDGFEDLLCPQQ